MNCRKKMFSNYWKKKWEKIPILKVNAKEAKQYRLKARNMDEIL